MDALHALQNEGTRAEVAQSFKEQGNEAVQEKRWIDAKEMYTKSIAVIYAKEDKWEKPEDLKAEEKLLRQMEELSHINRALCNLELGEFLFNYALSVLLLTWLPLQETTALALSIVQLSSRSTRRTSRLTTAPQWLSSSWTGLQRLKMPRREA